MSLQELKRADGISIAQFHCR